MDDFIYLEGVVCYDPDEGFYLKVSRVAEYVFRGNTNIVCWCTRWDPLLESEEDQSQKKR